MKSASDKVQAIIAAAAPNLAGKSDFYDVGAQIAREKQFYNLINDPFTGKPITSIQELNELIVKLDADPSFGFGALLPSGSENGGKVERILSQKYNLKATSKTRFSEEEQFRVKALLQEIADQALAALPQDKKLMDGIEAQFEQKFLTQLVMAMNGISIKNSYMTVFTKMSMVRPSSVNADIYEALNIDELPKTVKIVDIVSNIAGNKRTERRGGTQVFYSEGKKKYVTKVIINPDLNKFSQAAFQAVHQFAEDLGLLDPKEIDEQTGQGTLAPMDVSADEWRADVFQAISDSLGGKYKNLLLQDANGEYNALFNKYRIAEEIALGRSTSVLRGFIGELRGILIVDALMPNARGSLMGTAKVTLANSLASESAPVDMVVELLDIVGRPYGFQIKNTSEMDSYRWGNFREKAGMTVPNFYIERLQQALNKSEEDFFGSYVYNQPIDDDAKYHQIYGGFQEAFNSKFVPVYQKLALYIIRQITHLRGDNSIFGGTMMNDFFLMNNKIIPASSFYQAMNDQDNNLIDSSFNLDPAPGGGYYHYGDDPDEINYGNYTGQARIKYTIEVRYQMLLQSAYNIS